MLSIFYQNEVRSIWETYNAHYMHLNEFLLITNQSLVPLEMEIRNTKRPLGIIHWEYIRVYFVAWHFKTFNLQNFRKY